MGSYIPSTPAQREEMLRAVGVSSADELFAEIPASVRCKGLNLPDGKSELEVSREMRKIAAKNTVFPSVFRGAGAYNHYIPSIVKSIAAKEEFLTSYTPYQAEISQGLLQSIFEYQTMICELTGMDASNASVYDGASAAAEAAAMCRDRKRTRALVSAAAHPDVIRTMRTYAFAAGTEVELIPVKDGRTDLSALSSMLGPDVASVYLAQPNFYGCLEEAEGFAGAAHAAGAKLILGVNPIAAAILKTPADAGADIAVGEGQPLGMPLSFGGPYLGFMACKAAMMRKLPGRIVGETTDVDGRRAFVLTLQAREQHIRREKASSNICSNQANCALTASAYLAAMGPKGLREAARQCHAKAHYLAGKLGGIEGFGFKFPSPFFHEFVTFCPVDPEKLTAALEAKGILGGLPLEGDQAGCILWCCTEMNSREEIDALVDAVQEVCGK